MALQLLVFIFAFGSSLSLESVSGRRIVGNETDQLALLEFKKQVDDPNGILDSWNNSIHFCNWIGITCGRRHRQRVVGLNLSGKGLGGNISPSIGNLSFLHQLDIANNSFHGVIPQEIGNLIRVQVISLENNTLEGELPLRLANCSSLEKIYFAYNNFVGKIPVELSSLSKLKIISIRDNGLTGEIPASLGNISSISVISLAENGLQGRIPESLGHLTNLYFLSFHENMLSEYGMGGKATIQGDVFSYGILLLEMFTGKRPTNHMFIDDLNLHNFVKTAFPMQVMQILDPTLAPKIENGEEIEEEAINRIEDPSHRRDKLQDCAMAIIKIALHCSTDSPRARMNMNDVLKELHLIKRIFLK